MKNIENNASEINVNELVFTKLNTILTSNWTGTMTNLMSAIKKVSNRRERNMLPGSPSALRLVINRVVNRLRNRGIGVRFGRTTDHTRTRFVKFSR